MIISLMPTIPNLAPPPLPLLITGIAGVPGYNAFHHFRRLYGDRVVGVRRPSLWPLRGDGIVGCDIADAASVDRLWDEHRFAAVLHCAGSCRLKSCELDPVMAHRANVTGTEHVLTAAARHQAQVIHLSIDLVFAGREGGGYQEDESTNPVTVYGAKMVQAEQVAQELCPEVCTLRISLPMGISFNGHAGAIDWIASRFKSGKFATLYFDEIRTPKYTDCMNRLFHHLLVKPLPGTFHAGGVRRLSLYQIAQIVNRVGGYDPDLLQGCPRGEAGPMPPRAGDVTLDSTRLTDALGFPPFDPWPFQEALVPTDRQWHRRRERDGHGEGSIERLLYRNPNAES